MKIALMTWFHYRNYGTALQVVALYNYLVQLGHNVDIIKYIPTNIRKKTIQDFSLSKVIERHKNKDINYQSYHGKDFCDNKKDELFQKFLDERVNFTDKCGTVTELENLDSEYDAFVCGSDQIWAPSCFDSHYFLDFVSNQEKMVAYAPSIGLTRIDDRFVKSQMIDLIKRFNSISVREVTGAETIKSLTGQEAKVVVDPTLLLGDYDWEKLCDTEVTNPKDYLLVYFLGNNTNHWKSAYKFAKNNNLEVKIIPVFEKDLLRDGCVDTTVGPKEFVSLIRNAKYVCTDSFHGSIFSIIFHKQFTAIKRFEEGNPINQNSRLESLFDRLQLSDSLVAFNTSEIYNHEINYDKVEKLLSEFKNSSKRYLNESLSRIEAIKYKTENCHTVLEDHSLCCGCGACASECPVEAIDIKRNNDGFFRARVDNEKCINCGKCVNVCPFNKRDEAISKIKNCALYSYKDYDDNVLKVSSSGGFAYRLSLYFLSKGYTVAGCTFDKNTQTAKHILIASQENLHLLQGSKYMQSSFFDVIDKIKRCDNPVVIFGTPCQITAARKIFKNRNDFIYIDLICHGVPSYNLYKKYREYLTKKFKMDNNSFEVRFRYKPRGWREIYIYSASGDKDVCFHQSDDLYFRMFETGNCYMQSCYECRWRDCTAADLRIGDYWGTRFEYDETGVSMIACANEKGLSILDSMKHENLGQIKNEPITDYTQCQQMVNYPEPLFYNELMNRLSDDKTPLPLIVDKYSLPFESKVQSRKEHIKTVAKLILDTRHCN